MFYGAHISLHEKKIDKLHIYSIKFLNKKIFYNKFRRRLINLKSEFLFTSVKSLPEKVRQWNNLKEYKWHINFFFGEKSGA